MKKIVIFLFLIYATSSCYKEIEIKESEADIFEIRVNSSMENLLYESRDTSYSLKDSNPTLLLNNKSVNLDDLRIRGQNALGFKRKSFSVFLDEPIYLNDRYDKSIKKLERFKLIALAMDYTYIEGRISFGLLQEAGIMPLFFKFVELRINGNTQGIYMLVEDPEQFFIEEGSEYILRRGYWNQIFDSEYNPNYYRIPEETYRSRYFDLYQNLSVNSNSEEQYIFLSERLNLNAYFKKIALDYLLQNGDYTDEIYLYSEMKNDEAQFQIIPWDYDDIFSAKPHEVNRDWAVGNIYEDRKYSTMDDIYNDIGDDKLIFSIEDDLDYTIARDTILYQAYEQSCKELLNIIDEDLIDKIFTETYNELSPFYEIDAIIEQSKYDATSATKELWTLNMAEKQADLIERLSTMKTKLAL